MTSTDVAEGCRPPSDRAKLAHDSVRLAVIVGALGVVFGDIGTSPIYTLQTVFSPSDPHPVPVSTSNVFGVVSLVFWSVMIIVTVTYVLLAMRADNDGEGGILALTALAAEVRVCAPSTLMPKAVERMGVTPFTDFDKALVGADVVMMLRVQNEQRPARA